MRGPAGPKLKGWRLVGEEPLSAEELAKSISEASKQRWRARRYGWAALICVACLAGGPRLIAASGGSSSMNLLLVGLVAATVLAAVFGHAWLGARSMYTAMQRAALGGGYWVYEPLSEAAVEEWQDGWDGEVELDPDGKRREPKMADHLGGRG